MVGILSDNPQGIFGDFVLGSEHRWFSQCMNDAIMEDVMDERKLLVYLGKAAIG